jgi:tetratricopeptide (TPR) repeat protein
MSFKDRRVTSVLLVAVLFVLPIASMQSAYAQQSEQAGAALREGRRLLKRGQADQALIKLRNALSLYTTAKNNSGIADAHNEIGDLYLRQGQFRHLHQRHTSPNG